MQAGGRHLQRALDVALALDVRKVGIDRHVIQQGGAVVFEVAKTAEATYRRWPSHRTSARLFGRSSTWTPVSTQDCALRSRRKMWCVRLTVSNRTPHHELSANHSLLVGFSPVAAEPAPVVDMSG